MPEKMYVGNKGLIIQNQKALILEAANPHGESFWDLPGGRMEANETVEDSLHRELKEELPSLKDISIIRHLHTFVRPKPYVDGTHIVFNVFLITTTFTEITLSHEHQGYRWVDKNELLTLEKTSQKPLLQGFHDAILLALE